MMTQLQTTRFESSEHMRNLWVAVPEHGTPFEATLNPAYWAHVSARMRPWDRIEILPEDGSYFGELLVQDAGRLYAKVAVLRHLPLALVEVRGEDAATSLYEVKWAGQVKKWRVMRKADRAELRDKFQTQGEATGWLAQYVRTVSVPSAASAKSS